jgi:hypothetical protein
MAGNVLPAEGQNLFQVSISNGTIPAEGPKATGIVVPFGDGSGNQIYEFNALLTETLGFMKSIQGAVIDNSLNADAVIVQAQRLGFPLTIPPQSQAVLPLLVADKDTIFISSAAGAGDTPTPVTIIFVNVPLPAAVWSVA